MLRRSLLIGVAGMAFAGASAAQQRGQSRDDLLDALTRHIQICGEMTETQARLSAATTACRPRWAVSAPQSQPTPTPLQAAQPCADPDSLRRHRRRQTSDRGAARPISSAPLTPQPLGVPGGGTATLGAGSGAANPPPSTGRDPDAAFDPRTASYRPPENIGARPQPQLRRSGPRPVPNFSTPQPLVTLGATNLTYGDSRYWQVTVTLTSNTRKPVNTQAECTFMNAGRPVSTDAYLGPLMIQPGEQVTTELIGPPTTSYIDSTNCKVVRP